jgi:hypothetical protein
VTVVRPQQSITVWIEDGAAGYYEGTGGSAAAATAKADRGNAAASSMRVPGG